MRIRKKYTECMPEALCSSYGEFPMEMDQLRWKGKIQGCHDLWNKSHVGKIIAEI